MNKNIFAAIVFASILFSALAVLNHVTYSDLATNKNTASNSIDEIAASSFKSAKKNNSQATADNNNLINQDVIKTYQEFLNSPPRYLQGTDIRGEFYMDNQGELIITIGIKQRFDYFFLMTEHIPLNDIINIIHGHLEVELTESAFVQAQALLADYVQYFQQYNALMKNHSPKDNHNAHELAEQITNLRTDILGADVSEIFFGQSQALQMQNLNRLANKNQQIQYASSVSLPQHLKKNQQATLSFAQSKKTMIKALKEGASEQEINTLRIQLFGEEAAMRLKKLDEKRAQWNTHLAHYQKLNNMLMQTGLSQQEIVSQLNQTFQEEFELNNTQIALLAAQTRMASH